MLYSPYSRCYYSKFQTKRHVFIFYDIKCNSKPPVTPCCIELQIVLLTWICKSTLPHLHPAGFSVCLRYLTEGSTTTLLKLFPSSSSPVTLGTSDRVYYSLSCEAVYYTQVFLPFIKFWPEGFAQDIWTRVCVTVDGAKRVAQVFSGSNMSIRKMLPSQVRRGTGRGAGSFCWASGPSAFQTRPLWGGKSWIVFL